MHLRTDCARSEVHFVTGMIRPDGRVMAHGGMNPEDDEGGELLYSARLNFHSQVARMLQAN